MDTEDTQDEGRQQCPRCDFDDAVATLVYAGEFIATHMGADHPAQLSASEVALVDAGRAWLAEDAIARCFEDAE